MASCSTRRRRRALLVRSPRPPSTTTDVAKPHWPSTLRARLTLGYTTLLGIPLVALALGFYLLFARTLQNRTDEFIGDALTAFSRELSAERRAAFTPAEAMRATSNEVRFQDIHIT